MCGLTDELQFGGLMMRSTADAGIHACKHIQEARLRGEDSSAILVDVAQFFPSLNHDALLAILKHYGFPESRLRFFKDYLSDRFTTFLFNGNTTPHSSFDSGVVQGSALSPFLANIYIAPAIQATKRWLLWTYPGVTMQFYVDDGMIITSCKRSTPNEA
jgi:retron-type reverse transcriptase